MINNYEIVYILKEEVNDFKSIQKKIEDILNGEVIKHELLETRELAYPIKKETKGHYIILNIKTDGQNIIKFNSKVKFIKEIIRSLVINLDNEKKFKVWQKETNDKKN